MNKGICRKCKVRNNDTTEKDLIMCHLCEELFCNYHVSPKFVVLTKDYIEIIKEGKLLALMEADIKRNDGHPCVPYTRYKWQEMDLETERLYEALERMVASSKKSHTISQSIVSKGSNGKKCVDCGGALIFEEKTNEVFCSKCGLVQEKGISKLRERPRTRKTFSTQKIIGIFLLLIIIGSLLWYNTTIISTVQNFFSKTYTYDELVKYALFLINSDRVSHSLQNVSLSEIDSAQEHADDMLENNFFSHWGTDGSKPYMRYTLAGGRGAVAENVAAFVQGAPADLKVALKNLEDSMMNNDAEWNWGHRDNILDPFHNEVSIGISYERNWFGSINQVYFIEDFIDEYVQWSTFSATQNEVILTGSLSKKMLLSQVNIYYDNQPSNLTKDQLENPPYNGAYTQGTFVGMALPSGWESQEGITITAQIWVQSGSTFQIKFYLSEAFKTHGKGVYTIYLQTNNQDSLTSFSIWYDIPPT